MAESPQASWNLSEWKINLIGSLLNKASSHYIKGEYCNCFEVWKSIRRVFDNRLTEKELIPLQKLEFKIRNSGQVVKTQLGNKFVVTQKFIILLEKYMLQVNIFLKSKGLDIKDKNTGGIF